MQVVILAAGVAKRLRPLTNTKPKVLLNVVGKPMLAHILDKIRDINPSEVILIIGHFGEQVKDYVYNNYKFKTRFIFQKELLGTAHAIRLAKDFVKEPVLIVFGDTLFEGELNFKQENIIGVCETKTPERFGIVEQDKKGYINKLVEKPEKPKSNLALIGLEYIKDYKLFFECVDEIINKDIKVKGEYQMTDALQLMVDKGAKLKSFKVDKWLDCGKFETLLETNAILLNGENHIPESVVIEGSDIGPDVCLGENCIVKNSKIKNSIIDDNCVIENCELEDSLIGSNSKVNSFKGRLLLGDYSEVKK